MEKLVASAQKVEQGIPLTPELDQALFHGSSIGGARPKAFVEEDGKKFVAKFSSGTDLYNVVKAEYIAMRLAALAGLNAAPVALKKAAGTCQRDHPEKNIRFKRINILTNPLLNHIN